MNKILANIQHTVPSSNAQMERLKGIASTISDSLIKFYEQSNGGLLADEWIIENPNSEKWISYTMHSSYMGIDRFFSIEEIFERMNSIREDCQDYEIDVSSEFFFLNYLLPLTAVATYNPICIAYQGKNIGKIYLIEWRYHYQNNGELPFPEQLVANSFDEFIDMLKLADDDEAYQIKIGNKKP
jgi:SMI1 / KNR4 family (SUKH-1)